MRKGMWAAVDSRKHVLLQVNPLGSDIEDLLLHGTVEYGLKESSKKVLIEWAGHMVFTTEGKIKFYQVYMDSSPLLVASGKTLSSDANGDLQIQ